MHEAGLARAVVATMRERGIELHQVRLLVRGGHHDAASFDASMREYLRAELPAADVDGLDIVHVPFEHVCVSCGRSFDAAGLDEACPHCGGSALPSLLDEQIELELV